VKKLLMGLVAVCALAGCGGPEVKDVVEVIGEPPTSAIAASTSGIQNWRPPAICTGSCPRIPTLEPIGQICTLTNSSCSNGVLTCYYHCEPVESDLSAY
jgi:hypothetical protein